MYFKIGTRSPDPHFSWIIVKNPATLFERNLSKSEGDRKVTARFVDGDRWFEGHVENDPMWFLEMMREKDMSNYVHAQLHALCPFNLKGFDVTFRSVLRGNTSGSNLSDADFFAPKLFTAVMGPYPCDRGHIVEIFASVGITTTIIDDGTTAAFMAQLENIAPMSTTEFFQKLYLISYYLTAPYSLDGWVKEEQIEKLIELCKNWLDRSSYHDRIVKRLCSFNKAYVEKFELGLIENASEEVKIEREAAVEELMRKQSLHEKRHQLIASRIPTTVQTLIDFGCSEGRLTRRLADQFSEAQILGIDADSQKIFRIRRKIKHSKVTLIHSNILYPDLPESWLMPDFLVVTEVIEHMVEHDRRALIEMIMDGICPQEFILTTPNVEYNHNYGLAPGKLRHDDHKIEFTAAEFEAEVMATIREKYEIEILKVMPNEEMQPSFVIHCRFKGKKRQVDQHIWRRIRDLYAAVYLAGTNYTVTDKEMRFGLTAYPFLGNVNNIFYLAPTISPVDFDPRHPDYLEYPQACFDYYRQRGIRKLIGEEKYMGSRGNILVFRDPAQAKMMGFAGPVVMNSRSGMPFMNHDPAALVAIHAELSPKMTTDFIILDAEVMPWSFKAGPNFLNRDFRIPGEAALLARRYGNYGSLPNAERFIEVLEHFARSSELEIRPFHMLARGRVTTQRGRSGNYGAFRDVEYGFYMPHRAHLEIIESFDGTIFKPCIWHEVDLENEASMARSIELWHEYCEGEKRGEGFVYKPADFIVYGRDGYIRQPAVKVRGREYLRIIYGIDYLEPDWFAKVSQRSTKTKRILAIQEQELGMDILRAFIYRNEHAKRKLVAAFLGMDDVNMRSIDKTL